MNNIFTDPTLQETFEKCSSAISNIPSYLNNITGEINKLEKFLKQSCLPNDVVYELEMTVHHGEAQDGEVIYWIEKEGLEWNSAKKKILFLKSHVVLGPEKDFHYTFIDKQIEKGIFHDWKKDPLDGVPLLEAPVKVRLKMHPILKDFMLKITEDLGKFANNN